MTRQEVANLVASMGRDYAYYQFPEGSCDNTPPYIIFFFSESDDVYADNSNYANIEQLNIEYYTNERDFTGEETIELILKEAGFTWKKYAAYIESEKLYQTAYEMQVIIDEPYGD